MGQWDNVVLYGQYILDRKLVRRRRRSTKVALSVQNYMNLPSTLNNSQSDTENVIWEIILRYFWVNNLRVHDSATSQLADGQRQPADQKLAAAGDSLAQGQHG